MQRSNRSNGKINDSKSISQHLGRRRKVTRQMRLNAVIGAAICAGCTAEANAASSNWISTSAGTWNAANTSLWASSNVPGSATGTTNTDTATFNLAAGVAVTTTANWNIENITFSGAATASYNIGTAALALTAGGTITDSITGTVPEYITAPLTLQGAYSVTDTAATSNLNMSGAITGSSTFNLSGSSGTNASYGTIYVGSLTNFTGTLNVLTGSEDSVYNTAAADNATSQTINIGTSNTSSATFATSQNIGSGGTSPAPAH
jgi:hypothetical protein